MHADIRAAWTLEQLAAAIGSSRSTLAERFATLVGLPPIQYLTRWRMQVAANLLNDPANKLFGIAREVGYETEASFSRAFKREVGLSPTQWQRRQRSDGN